MPHLSFSLAAKRSALFLAAASAFLFPAQDARAAGNAPMPNICTRACWGASAATGITYMSSLSRAIVHHTAGGEYNTTGFEDSKADVRAIQNLHKNTNGWGDIGYHFLVDKFGNIFEGRSGSIPSLPRGAHDGTNTNSFGFNFMGYFHTPYNNIPTQASLNAMYDVIAWRMPNGWSPYGSPGVYGPLGNNVGRLDSHRRVKSTACPGDHIHNPYIGNDVNAGTMRAEINARIVGQQWQTAFLRDWELYQITNIFTGRCIDVPGFSTTPGAQLTQWDAVGNTAQTFQAIPTGGGWYKFKALCSGLFLDVSGGGGPAVIQWDENGATAQEFMLQTLNGSGWVRMLSRSSGKVVEIQGAQTHNGALVQVYDWHNHDVQKWQFHHVPFRSGVYELQNMNSGKQLDTPGFTQNAGVQMHQWTGAGNTAQRFEMTHTGFGWYEIRPLCSPMRLDVAGSSSANGTGLITWHDNDGAAQRFGFWDAGGGSWRIVCQTWVGQNKCIEIQGAHTHDGGLVQVYDWTAAACQRWFVMPSFFDEGDYEVVAAQNNKAIDVANCTAAPGTQMQIWDRNGSICQSFHLKPVGGGAYTIRSNTNGLLMDVSGCNGADGTPLIQYHDLNNDCQKFRIVLNDPAAMNWFLQCKATGTVIDNTGGSSANGNGITMWGLNRASANQRWHLYLNNLPPNPPATPTGLTASAASSTAVNLSWTDQSNNEFNFVVARSSASGGPYTDLATLPAGTTSYSHTGLAPGSTQYYVVRATNGSGASANSNQASATTSSAPPSAPSGLAATGISQGQVNLTWADNSTDESNFVVARSTASGGPYTDIATLGAGVTSYSNTGLSANTTYYYVVRATGVTGSSANSAQASAVTWPADLIVDNANAGFSASTNWTLGTSTADKYGADYRFRSTAAVSDNAVWTFSVPQSRNYEISAWWSQGTNRSQTAPYIMPDNTTVSKNQQTGGGAWNVLGTKSIAAGTATVKLSCWTTTGFVVMADAIKLSAR